MVHNIYVISNYICIAYVVTLLFIVHVIMGTNESFDLFFCVNKWVKDQGQNWLLEGSQLRIHVITW